ncbi:hypothetical protein BD779DRAFT_1678665 [Infundibulicybe gibba]|nr:hypothetical protein BD779DRAFT_1678665 [Infundibulicybe gibba]
MARIDPKQLALSADKRRIVMAGGGDINAIGIMSGRISACDVVNAYTSVSRDGGSYSLRRVILSPWAQELCRETSMWGLKLGFKTIISKTAYSGSSAPSTPKKPRSRFSMSVKKPSITAAPDGYPLSRGFDEAIPLYDGRAGRGSPFTFSDADFANLSQWPLYKKGQADLPVDSMVAVGYTVSLYEWPVGSKDDQLSTNLQFAILLGIPVGPPA